ncbi:MAG: hypothetical protein ACOH2H_02825 [Cypionkella sp.]
MEARFELISPSGKLWTEADLARAATNGPDSFAKAVAGLTPLYGVLVLSVDADNETTITDDFDAMLLQICLRSAGAIAQGTPVDYALAAHPEKVSFMPMGDKVRISGDVSADLVCDREGLAEALIDCATRYVAFKEAQLGPEASAYYRRELDRASVA